MNFFKHLLTWIRKFDFSQLGRIFLTSYGWVVRVVGTYVLKLIERRVDRKIHKIEDQLDVLMGDQELEERAKQNAQAIQNAKTDDELNEAFRNSLR